MGVASGKFGTLNDVSTVKNWSITDGHNQTPVVASNTRWGRARRRGVQFWNGNFAFSGKQPPVMPGEFFDFQGFTAPDDDQAGPGQEYSGQAMCKQITMNWNWASGEIIGGSADFEGHLELTRTLAAPQIFDSSVPDLPEIPGGRPEYSIDDGANWLPWTNISTMVLTLSCDVQSYVNSGTIIDGEIWTGQSAGPIDWNFAITEQDTARNKVTKGNQIMLRLYVTSVLFWEFKYGRVKDFTGITVNIDTGAIIQQTVNVEMDGVNEDDGTIGHIILPDTTTWWPSVYSVPTT